MMSDHENRPSHSECLDIIVPCYNEEDVVEQFCVNLLEVCHSLDDLQFRVLFVDDGSTDATLDVLNRLATQNERMSVYSLSRNFGHQIALTAGLDHASGDAAIMMDCDMQHPPSLIPRMVEQWRQGFNIVSAVRKQTDEVSQFKRLSSRLFYWLLNHLSRVEIKPGAADFVLLSKRAYTALQGMPERHRFIRGMVSWIGFRRTYIEYVAHARAAGNSKYTLWRMLGFASDAIFSFSAEPIRAIGRLGIAVVLAGTLYLIAELARVLIVGDAVRGWPSLVAAVVILGGLQLFAISISGEYLARIFEEIKQRPLYLLKQAPPQDD